MSRNINRITVVCQVHKRFQLPSVGHDGISILWWHMHVPLFIGSLLILTQPKSFIIFNSALLFCFNSSKNYKFTAHIVVLAKKEQTSWLSTSKTSFRLKAWLSTIRKHIFTTRLMNKAELSQSHLETSCQTS